MSILRAASRRPPRRPSVMKVALAASTVFHCLALLAFQEAFPSFLEIPEARLYRIDLIRPPVEELPDQENPSGDSADYRKQEEPDPPEEELREDTISLDTKDRRYVDYASAVKERLMEQWVYPEKARELLLEGRMLLVFTLTRSGDTAGMEVLQSSGHTVLDREACRAVRAASPFPTFPEHLHVHRLHIRALFDYRID